jgi:hypothetical protein
MDVASQWRARSMDLSVFARWSKSASPEHTFAAPRARAPDICPETRAHQASLLLFLFFFGKKNKNTHEENPVRARLRAYIGSARTGGGKSMLRARRFGPSRKNAQIHRARAPLRGDIHVRSRQPRGKTWLRHLLTERAGRKSCARGPRD